LLTYQVDGDGVEVVTIDALRRRSGIGTALLARVIQVAEGSGVARVWLITTNDNLRAIRFYQRRGFRITAVDPGAADRARLLKPSIPLVADNGVALHDELELELIVSPVRDVQI
jgi:RimJ/RimL family protein N-acetyltransferase